MTHDELVKRAGKWLRNTRHCGVVLEEFRSAATVVPDAIGFQSSKTILVECKTSIDDFYADAKKCTVNGPGPGRRRFYMTPPGLLSVQRLEDNRPGWGLLEVRGRTVKVIKESGVFETDPTENIILYCYVRRVHQYGLSLDEVQGLCSKAVEEAGRR